MDILLQKDLEHQEYAVHAVCDVFDNVAFSVPPFYYMNPLINIKDTAIKDNIESLQKNVQNIDCVFVPAQHYLHIDIKMETGTGKTFAYTKTIYELHKRFGFNKFVVVVPSLPIKEGARSFIDDNYVKKFFADTCGYNCEIELCTVEAGQKSKKGKKYFPSVVRDYVTGSDKTKNRIYVLLVNMALLTGNALTGVLTRADYDSAVESYFNPLDAIGATRPIVIIDEPHRFSRSQGAYKAIESRLKPQCIIRYGATFPEISIKVGKNKIKKKDYCNLIYNLDAYSSFEKGLIKGIAKEHFQPTSRKEAKVRVMSITNGKAHLQYKDKQRTKTFDLEKNDLLSIISPDFGNLSIVGISSSDKKFVLSNGVEKRVGDEFEVDIYANSYQEEMVRLALKRHFETERENFNGDSPIKIKTLALFFIDDIYSYRKKDKESDPPVLKEIFNRVLKEEIEKIIPKLTSFESEYKDYLQATLFDIEASQAGYFSQDNNDTDENIKKEVEVILKEKKSLLAIRNEDGSYNTRRFLFSKWTLKEGWDNPNVFTIAKLRSSGSEISKLQEVGRGLRLPVNTIGSRVSNRDFELNYIVDFTEADFAEKLIKEINGEHGDQMDKITDIQLDKIAAARNQNKNIIFAAMLMAGFVDSDKNVISGKISEILEAYPELNTSKPTAKIKDRNKGREEKVVINKEVYDKLKELWMILNQKYTLQYDDSIDAKIDSVLPDIILNSLTDVVLTSARASVKIEDEKMVTEEGGNVQYIIKRPMKYNEFLKHINKTTNLPIMILHKAFCKANQKKKIEPDKINEKTAINIINKFSDWKYNNLKGHFSYKKVNIPVGKTSLTNSDGTPVDTITKLFIGSKDAAGAINANYLYQSLAYDSDLELENIRADIDNVIVYGKIPRKSIAIPTIDGQTYSPDFMYLIRHKDGRQELNLVVETKDYEHDASLRLEEKYRIECAKAFFQSLKEDGFNVEYREQLRNDKIINIIKNIIAI